VGDEIAEVLAENTDVPAESKQPASERISFLKVPIDIVDPEQFDLLTFQLLAEGTEKNIVLLSVWDLLRARRRGEYRDYVQQAALVIPISKSIVKGIRFLQGKQAVRYMPFDFVIRLFTMLGNRELSSYFLGARKHILAKADKNIRATFPGLRVVGRYPGSFRRQEEATIIEAIRKASPSLLLVGKGVRGGERWIARNTKRLGKGLRLWCSDLLDVFAERKQHPSQAVFDLGLEWVGYHLHPFKLLRIFPFMYYNLVLLACKVFKKSG
jgi:N-acetylglucosaminyldiphosphoundecaprenol N-acetyl-beta-D-mannosaminyltransferase